MGTLYDRGRSRRPASRDTRTSMCIAHELSIFSVRATRFACMVFSALIKDDIKAPGR